MKKDTTRSNLAENLRRARHAFKAGELDNHEPMSFFRLREEKRKEAGPQSQASWGDANQRSGGGWGDANQRSGGGWGSNQQV